MFGLEDRHLNFVKETLRKHIPNPNAKFYIFGSRAKDKYNNKWKLKLNSPNLVFDNLQEDKSQKQVTFCVIIFL